MDAFLADDGPRAYERMIDLLLASPGYGEQQARLWLDLARYADSDGYEKDAQRSGSKNRLIMSIVSIMGVREAAKYINVPESEIESWIRDGVPGHRKRLVVEKRMFLHLWRPDPGEMLTIDDYIHAQEGSWVDEL